MAKEAVHYEFGGPYIGPIGVVFFLPLLVMWFAIYCTSTWPTYPFDGVDIASFASSILSSWSTEVFLIFLAYYGLLLFFYVSLPGKTAYGVPLKDGKRLAYPINGLFSAIVTLVLFFANHYFLPFGEKYDMGFLARNVPSVAAAIIVFSFILSIYLYYHSFSGKKILANGGNTPHGFYNFFIGRELNPRLFFNGRIDMKFFNELRPGLMLWFLLNLSFCYTQMKNFNVTMPDPWMLAIMAFEGYYVLDSVINEESILTTMDITTDGFGFMLVQGDLYWVPLMYSLQAKYRSERYDPLISTSDYIYFGFCILVAITGMTIFRLANSQKDTFRRDPTHPSVRHLKTLETKTGRKLLISGWWGVVRKSNYTGDLILALSWSLFAKTNNVLVFFYPIYFAILLIHRCFRDEAACKEKYGADWDKYCSIVKYRMIPGIF